MCKSTKINDQTNTTDTFCDESVLAVDESI